MMCQFCGVQTGNGVTSCNNCHEVWLRVRKMPIKVLNKIVKSARSPKNYIPKGER